MGREVENHVAIAESVWPDAVVRLIPEKLVKASYLPPDGVVEPAHVHVCLNGTLNGGFTFDLLRRHGSQGPDGTSVLRQKACALDVATWLVNHLSDIGDEQTACMIVGGLIAGDNDGSPCQYLYEGACKVLGLEEQE